MNMETSRELQNNTSITVFGNTAGLWRPSSSRSTASLSSDPDEGLELFSMPLRVMVWWNQRE
jgi:hypothetical protein